MKKIVKHFLFFNTRNTYGDESPYQIWPVDMQSVSEDYVLIREQDIELDIPDNWDPREPMIAALEAHRKKATADYQMLMNQLDGKIQQLRCIEMKPSTNP